MVATLEKDIEKFAREVARLFSPEKIILFGSHASGEQDPDSDVDLLVVMETDLMPPDQATKIRLAVYHNFPMDLMVRTPEQLKKRLEMGDPFMAEIVEKGEILYDGDD